MRKTCSATESTTAADMRLDKTGGNAAEVRRTLRITAPRAVTLTF
jgi:hypothetical protein